MFGKTIGRANCLAQHAFKYQGADCLAGVVHIHSKNHIIIVRTGGAGDREVVVPPKLPDELENLKAFSAWPLAPPEVAQAAIDGKFYTPGAGLMASGTMSG